ncbi:hypothetical protein V1J52_21890 [Streptomyces sp. TRM 70351]|uniref:hypothetical protein n=1 Tax=Streptomyces sp. TRM 70351 TaxID=3116552 RepID=UPI002E7B1D18|nr:hypothetical protein [Streptomyces sp. TRM 70351]MEE1930807.1 hypothetical protein [Streptomyces sp. TRM 70351]
MPAAEREFARNKAWIEGGACAGGAPATPGGDGGVAAAAAGDAELIGGHLGDCQDV